MDSQNQYPTNNNEHNFFDYVDNFLTENDLDESHSNVNADWNTDVSQSEDVTIQHENDKYYVIEEPPKIESVEDDLKKDWDQEHQSKDSIVEDQITNVVNNDEEDYEFNHIQGYKWEKGLLIFDVVLASGKNFEVPF